ncbi:hypothetical protein BJ166DRAFT_262137 [Pestalotiopsis sp. NC0098]|nr:hypothetical protein BJ166DRAFT_262137 [Pestalotiopsis sp. NC0098]
MSLVPLLQNLMLDLRLPLLNKPRRRLADSESDSANVFDKDLSSPKSRKTVSIDTHELRLPIPLIRASHRCFIDALKEVVKLSGGRRELQRRPMPTSLSRTPTSESNMIILANKFAFTSLDTSGCSFGVQGIRLFFVFFFFFFVFFSIPHRPCPHGLLRVGRCAEYREMRASDSWFGPLRGDRN